MDLPVDGVCINSPKTKRDRLRKSAVQWKPTYHFEERIFVISSSMARSVGYGMKRCSNHIRQTGLSPKNQQFEGETIEKGYV